MQSPGAPRFRTKTGNPNPIDVHVGARMRARRTVLGLSQEKLGAALGLTFQQIQKYERGTNRIGASRLYDLSHVLGVSISYFFDEMTDAAGANAAPRLAVADRFPAGAAAVDPLTKRETLELVRAYYKVRDPAIRKRLFELARFLSPTESSDP